MPKQVRDRSLPVMGHRENRHAYGGPVGIAVRQHPQQLVGHPQRSRSLAEVHGGKAAAHIEQGQDPLDAGTGELRGVVADVGGDEAPTHLKGALDLAAGGQFRILLRHRHVTDRPTDRAIGTWPGLVDTQAGYRHRAQARAAGPVAARASLVVAADE